MALNPNQAFNSALSLFCSLYQDMNPADLPEGLSPDNQDVVFLPGSVATRPALNRETNFNGTQTMMSVADFPLNNGNRKMVFLDSNGFFLARDLQSGAITNVSNSGVTQGGIQFKAENAFGKQWYAFFFKTLSDAFSQNPFVGVDVPQYFDGTNIARVTSDPPGAGPGFENLLTTAIPLVQIANLGQLVVTSVLGSGVRTIVIPPRRPLGGGSNPLDTGDSGETITYYTKIVFTCNAAVPLSWLNQQVNITGLVGTDSQFCNVNAKVIAVAGNTFTLSRRLNDQVNLNAQNGTAIVLGGFITRQSNLVTAYVGNVQPAVVSSGLLVQIANAGGTPINGANWGITSIARDANGLVTVVISTQLTNLAPGTVLYIAAGDATNFPAGSQTVYQILSAANGSTTFTVQWLGPVATNNAGNVYQVWSGTFQVQSVGQDSNGNWFIQYFQLGPDGMSPNSGAPTAQVQSAMAPGPRNCVCIFDLGNGQLTGVSVPVSVNVAGGSNLLQAINVPIGPAITKRRILAFTPAFGANYFYITPAKIPGTLGLPPVLSLGTILNDNTTTEAIVDFSDAQLTGGTPIDQIGNNLFNQVVLAPCLGVIEYQGRMTWWGEINNIKNLRNMGFDGGYVGQVQGTPLGWSSTGSTGGTVALNAGAPSGFALALQPAGGVNDCLLSQNAYQDYYGAPILQPNVTYILRFLAFGQGQAGNLVGELYSASQGVLANVSIAVNSFDQTGLKWVTATFSAPTPAAIPIDAVFRLYANGVVGLFYIDELELIDSANPVLNKQARVSYFNNPFGFDSQTGVIGLSTNDSLVGAFRQRGYLYFLTDRSLYQSKDNGSTEPYLWSANLFAEQCGACSPCAVDTYEDIALWAGRYGHRLFSGSTPKKLSQELETLWGTINWTAQLNVWLANDPINRVVYLGLPTGSAVTPNIVYPMSYRSVNTAYEVPDPLHISFSGRMICSDLARKSTRWNVFANCGAMVVRPLAGINTPQMVFGGGNGLAPGSGAGYAALYTLNPAKYTDDDYGVIASYYITYAYWNHDTEQNIPNVGLHRKLYTYLSAFITGVGNLQITPLVDSLTNPWNASQQYALSQNLTHDLEWRLNVTGDRVFFKVAVTPLPGQTDAAFNLQHMVVAGKAHPIPARGAYL